MQFPSVSKYHEGEAAMKTSSLGVVIVSIGVILASNGFGQPQPGGNSNVWHTGLNTLGFVRVRDELKLTGDQMDRMKKIGDEYLDQHVRPLYESFEKQRLNLDEQRQKLQDLEKPQREAYEKAKEILTSEQSVRLRQIEIWIKGPSAFDDPSVAKELDLTEQQRGALKTIADEYHNGLIALNKSLNPGANFAKTNRDQLREKIAAVNKQRQELRAAKDEECLNVLTADQKSRFVELKGEKFELASDPARGR
jgi:Spy/CpxP family protein refolding chaperone